MPFIKTEFEGLIIFEPQVWEDDRGYFYESYNERVFGEAGINSHFVQDNQAKSTFGVVRGLHYQLPPYAQAKLVRVISGEVLDVVVDIRPDSATYGQSYSLVLSAENKKQLFIPRGFAHGYAVLTPTAEFAYKCDNFYSKAHEAGISFKDPKMAIKLPFSWREAVFSEKDLILPAFGEHKKYL